MAKDTTWVSVRINQAHVANPSVTNDVLSKLELLLKAQMSEGQVSHKELADIAKTLLAANVPAPPKAEPEK